MVCGSSPSQHHYEAALLFKYQGNTGDNEKKDNKLNMTKCHIETQKHCQPHLMTQKITLKTPLIKTVSSQT